MDTTPDLGNLALAIALAAFEAMQSETFADFRKRLAADPTTPEWAR